MFQRGFSLDFMMAASGYSRHTMSTPNEIFPTRHAPDRGAPIRFALMTLLLTLLSTNVFSQEAPPSRVPAFEDGRFELDPDAKAIDGQRVRAPLDERIIRIAVLPDRTTGRAWGMPYLEAAVHDLERRAPDAVFTIGDMVQGYTRSNDRYDREADEYLHAIRPIADRFYPTAGNHDVISGDRDPSDTRFAERYRERFGPLHYSVSIGSTTMIVLFSDEALDGRGIIFSEKQLQWLESELEAAHGGPIVIFMHRPLWRYNSVDWWDRVQPLLAEHEVDAVLAGHFHAMQKDETRDGVEYHILGTCGGMIDQHPLTGQVQHITLLQLEPGKPRGARFALHHQIAGTTLPADFIVREDQDRVAKLKMDPGVARILDSLPDTALGSYEHPLRVELHNPIDLPVSFSIEPSRGPGPWTITEDATWQSRTAQDTFNPHTMHGRGRSMLEVRGSADLQPDERTILELNARSLAPASGKPGRPPQLDIIAHFQDTRGRDVPIVIRRRIPLERAPVTLRPGEDGTTLPISAWDFSVYDTLEQDPECTLALDESGRLVINIAAPSDLLAGAGPDERPLMERMRNPMADAVLITFGPEGEDPRERIYWELRDSDPIRLRSDGTQETLRGAILQSGSGGWRAHLPMPEQARARDQLQVSVSDNDETYHTQWRTLVPPGRTLTIEVLPEQ